MHKKLYISYLAIIVMAISISGLIFWNKGYNYIYEQSETRYLVQAQLVADIFTKQEFNTKGDYQDFVTRYSDKYNFRITVIDGNGSVYADSSTTEPMENHKDREEVKRALSGEITSVTRFSKTMGQEYSYSAVPVSTNNFKGVLRVSLPLSEIKELNGRFAGSILFALLICFVLAVIVAAIFTNFLTKPINEVAKAAERISEGDYNIKIYTRDKSVVGKLASSFNIMAAHLKSNIDNLTQRNAELEAMLSSMTAGVVAIGDASEILFCNKAFLETVNPVKTQIEGQSLFNVLRNAAVFEAIDEVGVSKSSVVKEGTLQLGNAMRFIRVTATPLGMDGKQSFGVLLIIEDITQLKKLERIRTDFVSNVTHELKTPLTSIRGFIDTLKNGAIKEEAVANRFLDIIDIEAERLYSLIQDILLLSEIESKREFEVLPCDINETIDAVIELLRPKLSDKIKIIFEPKPYLKPYFCNPDRMKQLLINLLDNAIKYTEEGSVTITCCEERDFLMLKIKDTGIGIGKDSLSRIFERFYRVDKGRSRKKGGTGLGLSIVKHIVELYNGNIQVESEIGKGTEFIITLPYITQGK